MNTFYVYVYLDQRKPGRWQFEDHIFDYEPFYIGKGTRGRMKQHLCNSLLNKKNLKSSIIKAIIAQTDETPLHYKIYENLSEKESADLEIQLIKHFGRKDNLTGCLANHTDGGEGQAGCRIPHLASYKKVYQYSLEGDFIKEWDSITSVQVSLKINTSNIPTSINRNGSCCNFRWSYEFVEKMEPIIKYKMPIKYTNIKRICLKTGNIDIFKTALDAEKQLKLRPKARNKILECIKGKIPTYLGYNWEYES